MNADLSSVFAAPCRLALELHVAFVVLFCIVLDSGFDSKAMQINKLLLSS